MHQRTCIFHLFLLGIPSSLVLSIKNRGMGGGSLLHGQNLLSVVKVICWWSLKEKFAQTLFEIKNKYIRILKCNLVRLQAPWTVCLFVVCVFFLIQQWPCHNMLTDMVKSFRWLWTWMCRKKSVPFLPGDTVKCTRLSP